MNLATLLQLPPDGLMALLLVFIRFSAMFVTAPVLGDQQVPMRAKIGLAALMAFLLFPLAARGPHALPHGPGELTQAVASELVVGLTLGFIAKLFFDGVQFAGHMLGVQMGFGMANLVDPDTGVATSEIGIFLGLSATMVFLLVNAHHWLILALVTSLRTVPLGGFVLTGGIMGRVMVELGGLFDVAFMLLLPFMGILLLADIAMGVVSRVVPQMNILANSFPLKIGVGFLTLALAMPIMAERIEVMLQLHMAQLLRLF